MEGHRPTMGRPAYTPRHAPRHASGSVRRLPVVNLSTGLKGVVGLSLLATTATGVTVSGGAASADGVAPSQNASAKARTSAALVRADRPASRSSVRTAAPAVTAPTGAGTDVSDFAEVNVVALAKPKPKPKPEPVAQPTADQPSDATPDASASGAASSGAPAPSQPAAGTPAPADAGQYTAAAAALGLAANAQRVYAAVRANFPQITTIGGMRPGDPGDHGSGHAVDVMCGSADGDAVAAYLQAHAGELGITYIIWKQRIWFPGSAGWRMMEDRGSATENHFDHVHISVG